MFGKTMKNTSGSQRRPNSGGGIKVEQDQKPQRVATVMVMDTKIEELMVQHEELLQSGHEQFSHAVSRQRANSWRLLNVTKLRSKLKGLMCNWMWSGAFLSAWCRTVFRECKTLPTSPINHLGWPVCAALGPLCIVTTA